MDIKNTNKKGIEKFNLKEEKVNYCEVINKIQNFRYCKPCIICDESVELTDEEVSSLEHGFSVQPKVCDKCKQAILNIRQKQPHINDTKINIKDTNTKGKYPYLVALLCGGLMECPYWYYEDYQIIHADSADAARSIYNDLNKCNYFYGSVIGRLVECEKYERIRSENETK